MPLLKARADHYDGLIVSEQHLPEDPDAFAASLADSLRAWRAEGKRGVWLKLPLQRASLLPRAVEAGFDFHHAQSGHAVLTKWLPETESNTIPDSILYNVGIGAFVLNHRNEVLLVQEASGILRGKGIWKLPTGLAEAGEDVTAAAEREVLEETGIRARFHRILAVRQSHGLLFGRSDLFFVCALRMDPPKQRILLQESELAAADWHALEAVRSMPIFSDGIFATIFGACEAYAAGEYDGFGAAKMKNSFNERSDLLMHGWRGGPPAAPQTRM